MKQTRKIQRHRLFWFFIVCCFLALVPNSWARSWDPRLRSALELSFAGNPEAGLPIIQSYQNEFPQDPNGLFVQAMVLEWKAGLGSGHHEAIYPDLINLYKKANLMAFYLWERDKQNVDLLVDFGNSYFLLARIYGKQGAKMQAGLTAKKSQRHLENAITLQPDRWDAYLPLGAYHYFAGNTPAAWKPIKALFGIHGEKTQGIMELKQALQGDHPYRWNARYALIEVYQKGEKNWQEALKYLDEFIESFPLNPLPHLKRAQILELKDPMVAVQAYLDFAARCAGSEIKCTKKFAFLAHAQAGKLLEEKGQKIEALKQYQAALSQDTEVYPERAKELQERMTQLGLNQ